MKKNLKLINQNILTIKNLEKSIDFALKQDDKQFQLKVIHAAFKRAYNIINKRKKALNLKEPSIEELLESTDNTKHKAILKLLLVNKLKPKEITNLKVKDNVFNISDDFIKDKDKDDLIFLTNRNRKYTTRTIQKIRQNAYKKVN